MISYTVLLLLSLLLLGSFFSYLLHDHFLESKEKDLLLQGREMARLFQGLIETGPTQEYLALLSSLDRFLEARLWVVDERGVVIAASEPPPRPRGRHHVQVADLGPHFQPLMEGQEIRWAGEHPLYEMPMLTVGVPLAQEGGVLGAVLLQAPITGIQKAVGEMRKLVVIAGFFATLLSLALSFYLARVLGKPLQEMGKVARNMAQGDFKQRLPVHSKDEVGALALSLNNLAEDLEKTLKALEQERDTLNATISSIQEGILMVDRKGMIIVSNEAAHRLLHLSPGTPEKALHIRDLPGELAREVARVLQGHEGKTPLINISPRKAFLVYSAPIRSKGFMQGAVILLHDVSALEMVEKMQRDFAANVSHELRRPLTAIRGFVEALRDGAALDAGKRERFLEIIHRESQSLEERIDSILEFSRLDKDMEGMEFAALDIRKPIQYAVEKMKLYSSSQDVRVEVEYDRDLPLIYGDIDSLERVMTNLLENALKFSPQGKKVQVKVGKKEEGVHVEVLDEGPGIEEEEKEYIWERFVKGQAARTHKVAGSGLGLSMVKAIVEAHAGRVAAEGRREGGAKVSFWLPPIDDAM